MKMSRKTIAMLEKELEEVRSELYAVRMEHGKFLRKVKRILGYKHWPDFTGKFLDSVVELINKRLGK
jgi:hypothetical protein